MYMGTPCEFRFGCAHALVVFPKALFELCKWSVLGLHIRDGVDMSEMDFLIDHNLKPGCFVLFFFFIQTHVLWGQDCRVTSFFYFF